MREVLISIQPKWCELIASGKKTVEVRKTRPKIDTPFKVYVYMTKAYDTIFGKGNPKRVCVGGGRVIGEFVCDFITPYNSYEIISGVSETSYEELPRTTQLSRDELLKYCGDAEIYLWHISDLVIYDKPKELHHFFKPCGDCDKKGTRRCTEELTYCRAKVITRPPQSWCYVELLKGGAE